MTGVQPAAPDPPEIQDRLWAGFSGWTGWDVGANCGQSLAHLVGAFRTVLAFEPATESYGYLTENFGRTPGLTLYRLAVSDCDGRVELAALPHLIETGQLATPGTHGMEWDPGPDWGDVPRRVVPARTADSIAAECGRPDFVKVDTEGHEGHVLRGAAGLLAAGKTSWLIEFHSPGLHDECEGLLLAEGYSPETMRHPHYPAHSSLYWQHGWIRAFAPR